jgi:Mce-associated membrane protein
VSRRLCAAGIALVAVLVITDGVLSWGAHRAESRARARADALSSASSRLPQLLTYSYGTFARDGSIALAQTTGSFHDSFASLLRTSVAPAAATKKITTSAKVTAAGVVRERGGEVTVLAFLTQTTTAPGSAPQVTTSRVDVTMKQIGRGWLIAGVQPV